MILATPTLTFPLGALVRFGVTFTRPPTIAEVTAAVPVLLQRDDVWLMAAPMVGDGIPVDPAGGVRLRILGPAPATETGFVYLTDVELVRIDTGVFQADAPAAANAPGDWSYRWEAGAGVGQATVEGRYKVSTSRFSP
jgi:hypothetical protein